MNEQIKASKFYSRDRLLLTVQQIEQCIYTILHHILAQLHALKFKIGQATAARADKAAAAITVTDTNSNPTVHAY